MGTGVECFFSLAVSGTYMNDTDAFPFQSRSAENLLGPLATFMSITSPVFTVGIVMMGLLAVVLVLGVMGIRKSRGAMVRKRTIEA
jgi:hypothetical protein